MKRIYITFGGRQYDETTERIVTDAPKFGADEVRVYDDKWLMTTEFYELNKWLWSYPPMREPGDRRNPHGFGWWCWKPFIMLHALQFAESRELIERGWIGGDSAVILYSDGDTFPIGDLRPLYDIAARDGAMFFEEHGWSQGQCCKADTFAVMGCDRLSIQIAPHATARFFLVRAGSWKVKQFLMEWQTYCLNPYATTWDRSVLGADQPELIEPRAEQAIMSNLVHKYGYRLWRCPDQWGEAQSADRDLYGTVFRQVGQYDKPKSLEGSRFANIA